MPILYTYTYKFKRCGYKKNCLVYFYLSMKTEHMADHTGGQRSVVNLGTKLRLHVEATQFWRLRSGFGDHFRFCKTKQRAVWSQTVTCIISNNFCFRLLPRLLINIIFLVFQKMGVKTAPQAPKLGYFDRQAPQLSAQDNHGTPEACVISHIIVRFVKYVVDIAKWSHSRWSLTTNMLLIRVSWISFEFFVWPVNFPPDFE